jgi:DNA ligase-1
VTVFRPLLAATLKVPSALNLPMLASPKLDGIRAIVRDGKLYSRNGKLIPNRWCQELFGCIKNEGFDGELIVGSATDPNVYNKTSSGVMSFDGKPDVMFFVFDNAAPEHKDKPYQQRQQNVSDRWHNDPHDFPRVLILKQEEIQTLHQLECFEAKCLQRGYEGIMVRSKNGKYKWGRSTEREQIIFKVKRFTDSEAQIISMVELQSNQNEQTTDELGRSKRSHEKAGLVPMNTMGAILVRDLDTGIEFEIGSGFSADLRQDYWDNQPKYIGKIVKYKHFEVGVKDRPRFPVYIGLRSEIDL